MIRSSLEIYDLETGQTTIVWQTADLIEAPNFMPDGAGLLINCQGGLAIAPLSGDAPVFLNTGRATKCNNDHGPSPDGSVIALSHKLDGLSTIFTVPIEGGTPRQITDQNPSYWHGWSPDGATMAYCARRGGQYDICICPANGGPETRLTGRDGPEGHNDGPDYSPDGRWIWFNSDRTGHAQIWKMRPNGSEPTQMTRSETVDWFPHPSPDGKYILYLSYPPGTTNHPPDHDVALRLMAPGGTGGRDVLRFNGGQGSINVPCWSPDSRQFAFVRYFAPTD